MRVSANLAGMAAEARALRVLLALASQAGWRVERPGAALPQPYGAWLYVEAAQLLLVPSSGALPFALPGVARGMLAARSDALVVSVTPDGATPAFAFGHWSRTGCCWRRPLTPWLDADRRVWLHTPGENHGYRLEPGPLRVRGLPSAGGDARGSALATAWLARLLV